MTTHVLPALQTSGSSKLASNSPWYTASGHKAPPTTPNPEVKNVIIAADGDEPGSPAAKAAERAASRLCREGREVKIARPPDGYDFNDLLMLPENVVSFPGSREAAHG